MTVEAQSLLRKSLNDVCRLQKGQLIEFLPSIALVYSLLPTIPYDAAITSISTRASFGRRATCTVERAGGAWLKNLP